MRSSLSTSRTRSLSAVVGLLLFLGFTPAPVFAQKTPFVDVPVGAYYEDAAAALLESGALDRTTALRPSDLATRAELVKLLVNVHDTVLLYPSVSSFNDVSRNASYFPYFEAAANAGWVRGNGNCYEQSRPCYANPSDHVNRAEAASLLVRSFVLNRTDNAPVFPDNPQGQWYYNNIQTSADHCVLQGDSTTGRVRPASFMNRAEMVTMFYRATLNLQYGTDCGQQSAHITAVSAVSSTRVRLTFDRSLNTSRAEEPGRYTISRPTPVQLATLIDSKTVELRLSSELVSGDSYIVTVRDLLAQDGTIFSDNESFSYSEPAGHITDATALTTRHIRLAFDINLDTGRAADASRYSLARASGVETIDVQSVTILNNRTLDLLLNSDMTANVTYRVTATHLLTQTGTDFTESADVMLSASSTGHVTTVTPVAANRIDVSFDVDLDPQHAEESTRYVLSNSVQNFSIVSSQLLTNRKVELSLGAALQTQGAYTVDVRGMQATNGVIFSDSSSFVYDAGTVNFHASLTGAQEVPSVTTTASGTGSFSLMADGLHYDISVRSMSGSITTARFQQAPPGQSGTVLFAIPFSNYRAIGVWPNLTNDQRSALLNGGIYVNVQTAVNPNGEIRGQLLQ